MSLVFVVDTEYRPLDPVHPGQARRMLARGEAAAWRRHPFTLIIKRAMPDATPTPLRLKIDPGSKTTGLALVTDGAESDAAVGRVLARGDGYTYALSPAGGRERA